MQEKIGYKSCFHVETISPDRVHLISEKEHFSLHGKIHFLLAPFLQKGTLSKDQIASALQNKVSLLEVYYALERLEKKHILQTQPSPLPPKETAFCELLKVEPQEAQKKLDTTKIFVSSIEDIKITPLLKALKNNKISLCSKKNLANLAIIICEDYLQPKLAEINKEFLKSKIPWILAKFQGSQIWLGPLFHPPITGCWDCLSFRLKQNRSEELFLQNKNKSPSFFSLPSSGLKSTYAFGIEWLAAEIFKTIVQGDNSRLSGRLLTFDFLTTSLTEHQLIKRPFCSVCSAKQAKPILNPLKLSSRPKSGYSEGGFRCFTAESTLKRYEYHVGPILGIVTSLCSISRNQDSLLYAYSAGHNLALVDSLKKFHKNGFRTASGGKGKSELQAKTGALCEAIERYSGVFQGYEPLKKASFVSLKDSAIDPRLCLHYSEKQYQNKHIKQGKTHKIPSQFREEEVIEWAPIWSLTEKRYKYIPAAFCYYGYRKKGKDTFCIADSNGNAAGNYLEEAILQGFFELVERDAVALWWYNRVKRPAVDLSSFKDPYISQLILEYRQMGKEVWALDLIADLKIPTFVVLSRNTQNEKEEHIFMGFGAHLDPKIALLRAITEMNQFFCHPMLLEEGSNLKDWMSIASSEWLKTARLKNLPYLTPLSGQKKKASDIEYHETADLLQDIHYCQDLIEKKGMEMLILDQTRPDILLPVVKVVVPGLRHFWPRFAPGRLYNVPVDLGWLEKPLKEEDLNPIEMFL